MGNSLPFVSILMRAHNDEALIGRALKAIFAQKTESPRGFRCGSSSAPPGRTSPAER